MIDVDFIEIGTSDYETLIESSSDETVGFSVEPVNEYLLNLPNKKNVKKVNCAISVDNSNGFVEVYYIPKSVIEEKNLYGWLKGCNSINNYHFFHIELNLKHLVVKEKVASISIENFLKINNIRKIKLLKLDTEGSDCFILNNMAEYLIDKENEYYPEKIIFEANDLTDKSVVNNTIQIYKILGYKVEKRTKADVILVKK